MRVLLKNCAVAMAAFFVTLPGPAHALRVMTYNLLTFTAGSSRVQHFKTVLQYAQPDVLVAEELGSQAAVDFFLNSILNAGNPGEWSSAVFTDNSEDDNALFYRTAKVQVLSHFDIQTVAREIDEWHVRPVGYDSPDAEMRIYVAHLSPNQGGSAPNQRLAQVTAMRARMETFPAGQNYVVCGDMNLYDSEEPAYEYMLSSAGGIAGIVADPIDTPGDWHDGGEFAAVQTQSTRTASVGGGAGGGMDDRFDFILRGPALEDDEGLDLLESTYTALGQDGLHFELSITDPPANAVVPQAIAQALYSASDHLPVFADFQLPPIVVASTALDFGIVIAGGIVTRDLSVSNAAVSPADELNYTLSALPPFGAPGGSFEVQAGAPENVHAITMSSETAGPYAANLTISSDDLDHPQRFVALAGEIWNHAQPSVLEGTPLTVAALDFGTHAPGEFQDRPATAYNFGYGPLQAKLAVASFSMIGDPRFSIVGGFTPALVDGVPASWEIHFDDSGAPDGTYEGLLVFHTEDESGIPGGTALADLVYQITANIGGSPVDAPVLSNAPRIGLIAISPNPAPSTTRISFGTSRTGPVELRIHDLAGRVVKHLVGASRERGEYVASWDGRDERGHSAAAGIYFVRLTSIDGNWTAKLIRVK